MLNGKQKRYLRSLAMKKRASMQIGKLGVTSAVTTQFLNEIEKNELLKVSFLQNTDETPEEATEKFIAADKYVELVQKIGRNLVFYKKAKEPKNRNISAHVDKLR